MSSASFCEKHKVEMEPVMRELFNPDGESLGHELDYFLCPECEEDYEVWASGPVCDCTECPCAYAVDSPGDLCEDCRMGNHMDSEGRRKS